MHTVNLLISLVEHHQVLAYVIIFLGLIFEGEIIAISVGILAHLGALNFWFSIFFILVGAISKTLIFYELGEFLYKKFNHHRFFQYIQKRVYNTLPRFKDKPFSAIFASNFIIGVNYLVIIFCGYEKIDYKKFLKAEILGKMIWAPIMLSLGYFFSYTALNITREIWKFSMNFVIKHKKKLKLVTHDGSFHTDDVFAAATLSLYLENLGKKFEIIRTRDEEIINSADYVFDVGGIYNAEKNRFDHHQVGGAGKRENEIPFSSFGLIWQKFGVEVTGKKEVADFIEQKLVLPVDANDSGVDLYFPKISPYTF